MLIEVLNLVYKYEDETVNALDGVSFNIDKGEWVSLIGHNGSGKSTLSKLLIGILSAKEGTIKIDGLTLNEENIYEIRKKIGIVYQNPDNQFVATSIEDDIAFGLENLEVNPQEMEKKIDDALNLVGMIEYKYEMPSNLSGGEKQRAAIASILAMEPDILILDESTSMLDPKGREDFINVVKSLKEKGKTIIMITHNMDEALLSDRCIVLYNGKIIRDGKTLDVLLDYDCLAKSSLEMPTSLYLFHELKKNNYKNKEVLNLLWELASKK